MYAVSPRWAQHPQLKRSSAPGRAGVIYSKFGKLYMGTPSALPVNLDALLGDSYRGEELPSHATHRFYQPLKPWNEPEHDPKAPVDVQTTHEAPAIEIYQMAGQHERTLAEGTGTVHYQGLPGDANDDQTHELERSRPVFQEMDDESSRGRLTLETRADSRPHFRPLSLSTLGLHQTEYQKFFQD
jgi:hypothetical protein